MSSYYGRSADNISNVIKLDNITFNGGTTYALTQNGVAFVPNNSSSILISIDGVVQQNNFTTNNSNIVFNFSPTSSNTCNWILHIGVGVAYVPAASSITKDKTDFVSTSSSPGLEIKGDGTTDGTLQLSCSQGLHGIKLRSPQHSTSSSYTLTFPGTDPAAGKMLQTDGSGNLSFVDAPSGTLVPLSTITTNNSAVGNFTFDNVFDSTYESYRILGYVAPDSSNNALQFEWRKGSSGSNSTHLSNDYNWVHFGARIDNGNGTGTDVTGEYNVARAKISGHSVQSDNDSSYTAFDMTLTDPRAVFMSRCNWYGVTTYQNASSHRHFNGTFGGSMNSNVGATGITFSYTGINIKYGRITIYGIKHD